MRRRVSVIGFFIMMTVPPYTIDQVNMTDTDLVLTTAGDRTVDRGLV